MHEADGSHTWRNADVPPAACSCACWPAALTCSWPASSASLGPGGSREGGGMPASSEVEALTGCVTVAWAECAGRARPLTRAPPGPPPPSKPSRPSSMMVHSLDAAGRTTRWLAAPLLPTARACARSRAAAMSMAHSLRCMLLPLGQGSRGQGPWLLETTALRDGDM